MDRQEENRAGTWGLSSCLKCQSVALPKDGPHGVSTLSCLMAHLPMGSASVWHCTGPDKADQKGTGQHPLPSRLLIHVGERGGFPKIIMISSWNGLAATSQWFGLGVNRPALLVPP